jgi:hypothetical protein
MNIQKIFYFNMTSKAGILSPIGSGSHHGNYHRSQHGTKASKNEFFGIENSATNSEIMTSIRTFHVKILGVLKVV